MAVFSVFLRLYFRKSFQHAKQHIVTMLKIVQKFGLISVVAAAICISLHSCDGYSEVDASFQPKEISTRADVSEITGDKYGVTQRMAEIFISSNKENPPFLSVEPYLIDGITCFYIFNFENGFKVVSADTRLQPILAESNKGCLVPSETGNPGVKVWLKDTADRIRELKENNLETGEDYSGLWSAYRLPEKRDVVTTRSYDVDSVWVLMYDTSTDTLSYNAKVGPLLSTEWGQGSPWNSKMPQVGSYRCVTGCVAVATAQVLYYFNRRGMAPKDFWETISIQNTSLCPTHGGLLVTLNKSNYNSNSTKWNAMTSNSNNVSYLMLDLGERLKMHYGIFGSGVIYASDGSIPRLSDCGINSSFNAFSFSRAMQSILGYKPLIVGAMSDPLGDDGHVWVIDGCKDYSIRYTSDRTYYCIHPEELISYPNNFGVLTYEEMMSLYPDASGGWYQLSHTVTYDNQNSLHMNWGWDGNNDGWFNLLDTNDWIYSDPFGNTYNYLYNRVIHYNITTSQLN